MKALVRIALALVALMTVSACFFDDGGDGGRWDRGGWNHGGGGYR